jgi:hypothetical protein
MRAHETVSVVIVLPKFIQVPRYQHATSFEDTGLEVSHTMKTQKLNQELSGELSSTPTAVNSD